MISQRYGPAAYAGAALVVVWLVAVAGYRLAADLKFTADKVSAYAESVDLGRLAGEDRGRAIRQLQGMIADLTPEERIQVWPPIWNRWVAAMTEREKSHFLEATALPGFKQTPGAFDQLPPERRQQAIEDRLKQLREARAHEGAGTASGPPGGATTPSPP